MTLSLLIPSIKGREVCLSELVCDLIIQCGVIKSVQSFIELGCSILIFGFDKVEIIIAVDDRQITTGAKRNLLLKLATKEYCAGIDCDDYVYPYYVSEVLKAIQSGADCIATNGIITTDNSHEMEWRLSKYYQNVTIMEKGKYLYLRTTNHISPVKTELARQAGFPDKSNAEDKAFSERLNPLLKTEVSIEKPLYHYRYSTKNKSYT